MWGQNWGQMIWGQIAAVPALGFWGLIVLAAVLGVWGVRRLRGPRPRMLGMIVLALALLVPISARALPFTFTNGTVADANQVNANFAAVVAGQGLAPAASANLVDLVQTGVCPESAQGIAISSIVGSDGITGTFNIPTGQTLVLMNLNTSVNAGPNFANNLIRVQVSRFLPTGGGPIDVTNITLNAQGAGSASISFGAGSPFRAGTNICVFLQDVTTGVFLSIAPSFTSAHGFLTTQ